MRKRSTFSHHSQKNTRQILCFSWRGATSTPNLAENSRLWPAIVLQAPCKSRMRSVNPMYGSWCAHRLQRLARNTELDSLSLPAGLRASRSEEHTSELQSQSNLVCRL